MRTLLFVAATALLGAGCTAVTVEPLDPSLGINYVCIEENPKVIVVDFVTVLRDGFDRHGIATELASVERSSACKYVLKYTALQSWDLETYLSHAELRLESDGLQIASAEYHLKGKGGLSFAKWDDTKTKIDPVIDELLAGYVRDPNSSPPVVPPHADPNDENGGYDDLEKLYDLLQRGELTEEEYENEKSKILNEK